MFGLKKNIKYDKKMIFVIGTGRSGTHWIGNILSGVEEIQTFIEEKPQFPMSTEMALNRFKRPELFPKLIKTYNKLYKKYYPKMILDKTHPNIWLAESLNNIFPNSCFIGMLRNPYATISSMFKHDFILKWQREWKKYPVPNEFLGITQENKENYENLKMEKKCALRWLSHKNKLYDLKNILKEKLKIIKYEDLILNTEKELEDLKRFLGLKKDIPFPVVKRESLDKWKKYLTEEQCENIKEVANIDFK